MTQSEKLEAILACVQTDPGNRGLAHDPVDNLFTATAGDFERACRNIAMKPDAAIEIVTGFFIPTATPAAYETDGPLGAAFLIRSLTPLGIAVCANVKSGLVSAIQHALIQSGDYDPTIAAFGHPDTATSYAVAPKEWWPGPQVPVKPKVLFLEAVGPAADGRCYSMRGRDITEYSLGGNGFDHFPLTESIGIGDGGNEIGMGKIPHETIVKNIPNGDLIHCRVPTDHLIVAGVSNWGAYALAAGVYVLRNEKPPANLFDPDYERKILEIMVEVGPLVDGVTGKQEATVDGLSWDEYVKPLIRMREILEC